ncbi:MAG TPA: extracellular solute-binding protein [Thermaerobacter sp.]
MDRHRHARRAGAALRAGFVLVTLAAVLLLATACGGSPASQEAGGGTTIVHWQHHDDARAKVLASLKADFEAAHPGVTVQTETIPYGDYFNRLLTALAAGQGPDVFQIPATMAPELIASGLLAPLPAEVVSPEAVNRDYIPWTVELAQQDGRVYGLPTDVQTLVMFINEDLAREAGLDPDRPPTTWEELLEQAKQATRRGDGGLTQAGLDTRYKWAVYTLLLTQYLDPVVDLEARSTRPWTTTGRFGPGSPSAATC